MFTSIIGLLLLLKQAQPFQHFDDDNSGIIFEPFQNINILQETLEITYSIDISAIENLKSSIYSMGKNCPDSTHLTDRISALIPNAKTPWYRESTKKSPTNHPESFHHLDRLKSALDYYNKNSDSQEKCKFLHTILTYMRDIDTQFNRLSHADMTTLGEVISIDRLKNDIIAYTKNKENVTLLFDFSYKFLTEFISNSKFSIYRNKNIQLTFEIPIYKHLTLYSIYPKPIIQNLNAFQLKISSQYATKNENEYILFTGEQLENMCFDQNENKFCIKPIQRNECDNAFINTKNKSDTQGYCFESLPRENSAIQINKNVYFSIIFPTTVTTNCGNGEYPITIYHSTKFTNLNNCSLDSDFFTYDHSIDSFSYKIKFSKNANKEYTNWVNKFVNKNLQTQWIITIIFMILYSFSFSSIIFFINYKKEKMKLQNEVTFHVNCEDTIV